MEGKRLLHSLRLEHFLSFGGATQIELEPLNVLIGQNASGKSNFIHAIEFLRAVPRNISAMVIEGGGVDEYLYKGKSHSSTAEIAAVIEDPQTPDLLRHSLSFTSRGGRLQVVDESIHSFTGSEQSAHTPYYEYQHGEATIWTRETDRDEKGHLLGDTWEDHHLNGIKADLSILAQRTDPENYPALAFLAEQYRTVKIYRSFNLQGLNSLRVAQRPDLPDDFLEEDGRNLSLILNDLHHRGAMNSLIERMQTVYEDVEDITVKVSGGTVQTFIRERGMASPMPAARLSDGTLRYLCLLAILYHPSPPPLICIEEPEIGMHPDLIASIADMLVEASQRTQLIVTTHSDMLLSALSSVPEAIVVSERTEEGTQLRRLDPVALQSWLEDYSLGGLWRTGEIGGVRY